MRDTQAEFHQLMLERLQMLEEALRRAIDGVANQDDWKMICGECGIDSRYFFETKPIRSE